MHRHFGSRYLIDLLNEFGFCLSYSEVLRFESCAANQLGTSLHDFGTGSFLHFVGDNVDHNADTIDGLNTFHGMGIIACVNNPRKCHLPPIKQIVASSNDVVESSKIEMKCPLPRGFTVYKNVCDITRVCVSAGNFEIFSSRVVLSRE